MNLDWLVGSVAAALLAGEGVSRVRTSAGAVLAGAGMFTAAAVALAMLVRPADATPFAVLAPLLVLLLGGATLLARPPSWREPSELGRVTESTLLLALAFASRELEVVAGLWLVSMLPGLRFREQAGVSRRPFVILATLAATPVVGAMVAHAAGRDTGPWAFVAVAIGAGIRMGVPPFSPLVTTGYQRLPLGRTALVAASRPSVALLLAARLAWPDAIEAVAEGLQAWAALAAITAAFVGLAATTPRRSLASMAATQAAIIQYGLVSPGEVGVAGALVQWAGQGLSLVGLGLLVEATESRVGHYRATRIRGLLGPAPGMALLFLGFAATMSGFPGTTGFVGEDLVMQARTGLPLVWRPLLLLATTLNGVTMLKMFSHTFLGPASQAEAEAFPPLSVRERLALGAIAAAIGVLTLSPTLLTP